MSDLSPGQEVHVSGASGGAARVIYVKGETVRVRMADGRRLMATWAAERGLAC